MWQQKEKKNNTKTKIPHIVTHISKLVSVVLLLPSLRSLLLKKGTYNQKCLKIGPQLLFQRQRLN